MPLSTPSRLFLLINFDSTITTKDTLSKLAEVLYKSANALVETPLPPWSDFSDSYAADLATYHASQPSPPPQGDIAALLAFYDGQRQVEARSARRAEAAGLLRGVKWGDLSAAGEAAVTSGEVELRPKVVSCMSRVLRSGGEVVVVSMNWSSGWIHGCLRGGFEKSAQELVQKVSIGSNELEYDNAGMSSGMFNWGFGGMFTGTDKWRATEREFLAFGRGQKTIIAVGDSFGDLDCLVNANIGIILQVDGQRGKVEEALEHGGVKVQTVAEWNAQEYRSRGGVYSTAETSNIEKIVKDVLKENSKERQKRKNKKR